MATLSKGSSLIIPLDDFNHESPSKSLSPLWRHGSLASSRPRRPRSFGLDRRRRRSWIKKLGGHILFRHLLHKRDLKRKRERLKRTCGLCWTWRPNLGGRFPVLDLFFYSSLLCQSCMPKVFVTIFFIIKYLSKHLSKNLKNLLPRIFIFF